MYEIERQFTRKRSTTVTRTTSWTTPDFSHAIAQLCTSIPSQEACEHARQQLAAGEVLQRSYSGSTGITVIRVRKITLADCDKGGQGATLADGVTAAND